MTRLCARCEAVACYFKALKNAQSQQLPDRQLLDIRIIKPLQGLDRATV